MSYKAQLLYFRQTGKFLATAVLITQQAALFDIWEEIDNLRRLGSLPGLRPGAGRDLFIVVDVPDHPERVLHMVMGPFLDEDDVTPARIPTSEMVPLVRVPLAELPRTSTRDVVKPPPVVADEEITPVDVPRPSPPDDHSSSG